jgi:phosphoribosylanthranilate isomerase
MSAKRYRPDILRRPQVKVCGLTQVDQAVACAIMGADAIGLVFYPPSPRFVSVKQAAAITAAIDGRAAVVGVFVDESADRVLKVADRCGLTGAQLHGQESPETAAKVARGRLTVIKALFLTRYPFFDQAADYNIAGVLLECGQGRLPGGNAKSWDWSAARQVDDRLSLILAGGLTPDNVTSAIAQGLPDAVDVSSGVEAAPGKKDLNKVDALITAVMRSEDLYTKAIRRIF